MIRVVYTRVRFLFKEHEEHVGSDSGFCNNGRARSFFGVTVLFHPPLRMLRD